jgi:hypothetical protein
MIRLALVGIRFIDGKKIFECCLHFFYSNLSCPSGIATCTALHAIRRRVCPLPLWFWGGGGGTHSLAGEGGSQYFVNAPIPSLAFSFPAHR